MCIALRVESRDRFRFVNRWCVIHFAYTLLTMSNLESEFPQPRTDSPKSDRSQHRDPIPAQSKYTFHSPTPDQFEPCAVHRQDAHSTSQESAERREYGEDAAEEGALRAVRNTPQSSRSHRRYSKATTMARGSTPQTQFVRRAKRSTSYASRAVSTPSQVEWRLP